MFLYQLRSLEPSVAELGGVGANGRQGRVGRQVQDSWGWAQGQAGVLARKQHQPSLRKRRPAFLAGANNASDKELASCNYQIASHP